MKTKIASPTRSLIIKGVVVSLFSVFLVAPTLGADTLVNSQPLVQPADIPDVAPLPFTGQTAATFTIPTTMVNISLTPNQGVVGDPFVVSGKGLPASTSVQLT